MIESWFYKTTIYQIYPRSFLDTNHDGIGDIRGIIEKLDYIRGLGFETIWVSPYVASAQRDFGYDITDYCAVAPEYGNMEDVDRLIEEVHKRGMKILFDMVLNHTSDQHSWFIESKSSRNNPKANWYIWHDKPNNWKSITGPNGWQYCKERDQYYFCSFLPFQPDLNYRDPVLKQTMFDICRFWLKKGMDGFRLDIFNCILKDPQFRDNPFSLFHPFPTPEWAGGNFQKRLYSTNWPENESLALELRALVDEFEPKRLLLGEVFGGHDKIKTYLGQNCDGLHLIFLFDILFYKFKAGFFRKKIIEQNFHYPHPFMPTIVFSNHDQWRSIRRIGNDLQKAKVLAFLKFTLRGVPTIYYGEEIGMRNKKIPLKDAKDSLAHQYKWIPEWIARLLPIPINRDACRTPMQWNKQANAGFTDAVPWLPVNKMYVERNVETEQKSEGSLLNIFIQMMAVRKKYKALHEGNIGILPVKGNAILGFCRKAGQEELLVFINFSKKRKKINFDLAGYSLVHNLSEIHLKDSSTLEMAGLSACIFIKD